MVSWLWVLCCVTGVAGKEVKAPEMLNSNSIL